MNSKNVITKLLTTREKKLFDKLRSPSLVQDFLDGIPFNFESEGVTCRSPRNMIAAKTAHCFEAAMFAYAVLLYHGYSPKILSLKVTREDYDHVVVLFKKDSYWGAVSKTNHSVLRFRDPVYKSVRELAMTYFHEYFLKTGVKTMRGYSRALSFARFGLKWIVSAADCWDLATYIYEAPHISIVPKGLILKKAHPLERRASGIPLHKNSV